MYCCNSDKHEKIREKIIESQDFSLNVLNACKIFALLSEPSRMKIMLALSEGELCVYHICDITGAKQSATSQHLKKLKDDNLIKSRKEANQVLYSIADNHVVSIIKTVLEHTKCEAKGN